MGAEHHRRTPRRWRRWLLIGISGVIIAALLVVGIGWWRLKSAQNEVFPRLEGTPEIGRWYGIYPEGAQSALGEEHHGLFRLGKSNHVMVLLNGGGVSVNAESAANPERFFNTNVGGDALARLSLGSEIAANPFADWSVIVLPYTTGDFHAGAGDFNFQRPDGTTGTLHHVGYRNMEAVLAKAAPLLGTPDHLLVAGYSAGGFGTALLADRIMSAFPHTTDVTVAVDSALLLNDDWRGIAEKVWHAPSVITERLTGDNLVLDSLTALAEDHPQVKVLFSSTTRDESLVEVQAYFDTGTMTKSSEGGKAYEQRLRTFIHDLREAVPHSAFYIARSPINDQGLTFHTLLLLTSFSADLGEITPAEWIHRATEGALEDYGLDLLG